MLVRRMLAGVSLVLMVWAAPPVAAQLQGADDNYRPMNLQVQGGTDSISVSGTGCSFGPETDTPVPDLVDWVLRRGSSANGQILASGTTSASPPNGAFEFEISPVSAGRYRVTVTCGGSASATVLVGPGGGPGNGNQSNADNQGNSGNTGDQVAGQQTIRANDEARGAANGELAAVSFDSAEPPDSAMTARLGAAMVAIGGIAVWAARRRRNRRSYV